MGVHPVVMSVHSRLTLCFATMELFRNEQLRIQVPAETAAYGLYLGTYGLRLMALGYRLVAYGLRLTYGVRVCVHVCVFWRNTATVEYPLVANLFATFPP